MTISHDVGGDGPAVLLLHAGVCDRRMWDPQWQPLIDAGFRVIRCDLRGFGQSPLPAEPYSNTGDVLALLDSLGIGQVSLVGSSYGGKVALEVAASHPDRVAALVLLSAALPGREPSDEVRALGAREDALVEAGDLAGAAQLMVDRWLGPDAGEDAKRAVHEMQVRAYELQLAEGVVGPVKPEVDLAAVTMPCLAVSGAHDAADFRDTAAVLPAARHVELPWASHLASMERPAEVTGMIVAFLREHQGSRGPL
ncbi:pimeloyl-ACP methyl ester carboxylesterase [Nonomuraea thailandensis]|uniref:Pimeloyl-ACP methyl ester carboxylesterase n=1 Tax=Nonomuraea thailandensis TaxID=1188745 RepID=A0A9X2GSV2_9ACTN|nr:alpha/beta hydrolase [Nonomuraea thailandensis]MCP2363267.1 pimeloyl-ACP methyl ester carboxylesterase [Nonomuraea thailandensis]